jgi:hypothetical protein
LGNDGICHFTGEEAKKPSGILIQGMTDILQLITGIVWDKPGPGFAVFDWDGESPIPREVRNRIIGIKLDKETIDFIQADNNGRGILLSEAGGDINKNGLTPDEWMKKYGTNGVAQIAKMRISKFVTGGGVKF